MSKETKKNSTTDDNFDDDDNNCEVSFLSTQYILYRWLSSKVVYINFLKF